MNMLRFASEMARAIDTHAAREGVDIESFSCAVEARTGALIVRIGQSVNSQQYLISHIVGPVELQQMEAQDWLLGYKAERIVRAFAKGLEDARTAAAREGDERFEIGRRVVYEGNERRG